MTNTASVFLLTELCLVCFSLLLPFVFLIPSRSLDKPSVYVLLYVLFLKMSFVSGMLTGVQFPLATRLHLRRSSTAGSNQEMGKTNLAHTAGLLYGGDLLGSLIESVLLLPSLGLKITCFILETIKGGSFILVLLHARYANKQR